MVATTFFPDCPHKIKSESCIVQLAELCHEVCSRLFCGLDGLDLPDFVGAHSRPNFARSDVDRALMRDGGRRDLIGWDFSGGRPGVCDRVIGPGLMRKSWMRILELVHLVHIGLISPGENEKVGRPEGCARSSHES